MNSKPFIIFAVVAAFLLSQASGRPQGQVAAEEGDYEQVVVVPRQNPLPDWVVDALASSTQRAPAIPVGGSGIASLQPTTRRPQLGDIINNGLQGLFQGIVRAPGEIATRVQTIIDGILRRPSTTVAPPALPAGK